MQDTKEVLVENAASELPEDKSLAAPFALLTNNIKTKILSKVWLGAGHGAITAVCRHWRTLFHQSNNHWRERFVNHFPDRISILDWSPIAQGQYQIAAKGAHECLPPKLRQIFEWVRYSCNQKVFESGLTFEELNLPEKKGLSLMGERSLVDLAVAKNNPDLLRHFYCIAQQYYQGHDGKADPEKVDDHGRTLLHWAVMCGQSEEVRKLVKCGYAVNKKVGWGNTPLHLAAALGHALCIEALVAIDGILLNEKNKNGKTPLHVAAESGHALCIEALVAMGGILLNEKDILTLTPLLYAARQRDVSVIKALVAVDNSLVNMNGSRVLHIAAKCGHVSHIEMLLAVNSHLVDEKDHLGRTPLDIAEKWRQDACADLLREYEAINSPIKGF